MHPDVNLNSHPPNQKKETTKFKLSKFVRPDDYLCWSFLKSPNPNKQLYDRPWWTHRRIRIPGSITHGCPHPIMNGCCCRNKFKQEQKRKKKNNHLLAIKRKKYPNCKLQLTVDKKLVQLLSSLVLEEEREDWKNKPPGSLIGVIYGWSGVREGCIGVSLPIPYRDVSLVKKSKSFSEVKNTEAAKSKIDIYRYGVETTTLSEITSRSTANNKDYEHMRTTRLANK